MSRSDDFRTAAKASRPDLGPGELLLLDEACRLVDRLDRFDRVISGDEEVWVKFRIPRSDGDSVELVVDSVVSEARQTAAELRHVVKQLDLPAVAKVSPSAGGVSSLIERAQQKASGRR